MTTNDALAHKILIQKDEIAYLETKYRQLKAEIYVDDGFGNVCGPCVFCRARMTIIRPGKFRCMQCENLNFLRKENERMQGEIDTLKERPTKETP